MASSTADARPIKPHDIARAVDLQGFNHRGIATIHILLQPVAARLDGARAVEGRAGTAIGGDDDALFPTPPEELSAACRRNENGRAGRRTSRGEGLAPRQPRRE
jgi:hypothetical protein